MSVNITGMVVIPGTMCCRGIMLMLLWLCWPVWHVCMHPSYFDVNKVEVKESHTSTSNLPDLLIMTRMNPIDSGGQTQRSRSEWMNMAITL